MIRAILAIFTILWCAAVHAAGFCVPLAGAKERAARDGHTWTDVSPNEWQFLRGIYAMNPLTPPGLPYGAGAAIVREQGDEGGVVVFIDGDVACSPMPVPKSLLDLLATVAAGRIFHQGDPL
jgi:hypothetical protein